MHRRDFLAAATAAAVLPGVGTSRVLGEPQTKADDKSASCGATYASVQDAIRSPRETLAYVPAIYAGTGVKRPDYLATVDVDPSSKTYSQVVHRLPMPNVGDELHHFGWNACSSCHGDASRHRRYLILPGLTSGRIHIVDVANPRSPKMHKVIEPDFVATKTNLSTPHTVHCLPDGHVMLSMLGDRDGNGPGGFLLLDERFDIAGRWERNIGGMKFNYDFWYQPRHNVMVSSEWAAPKTVRGGFQLDDVKAGRYGSQIHFWDWSRREVVHTAKLGEAGLIPLEVRFFHDPASTHGYVGAALSSAIWHWQRVDGQWKTDKVVQVEPIEVAGWPFPVPGLITDLVVSLDDRWLYFSNWLHGDIRQYDLRDPAHPKLAGQMWLGGVLGKPTPKIDGRDAKLAGGPQMLQLSLDGRRLYVTNSLYSTWDNQFYPAIGKSGSYLLQIDCDTDRGGLSLARKFHIDFGREPDGPSRAHEIRFPGGDSTSDIFA